MNGHRMKDKFYFIGWLIQLWLFGWSNWKRGQVRVWRKPEWQKRASTSHPWCSQRARHPRPSNRPTECMCWERQTETKTRERLALYVAMSAELEEKTGDESKIDPVALLNSTGKSGIHKFETACLLAPFLICIPGSIMHVRVNPPRVQCFVSSFKESCQRHFRAKGTASSRSAAVKSKWEGF